MTATIHWHTDPADRPDPARTVLLAHAGGGIEMGFLYGTVWRNLYGESVRIPAAWADLPNVPPAAGGDQ